MSTDDVRRIVPGCDRTFSRRIARGDFPKPILIGHRRHWYREEIERWLTEKAAATA